MARAVSGYGIRANDLTLSSLFHHTPHNDNNSDHTGPLGSAGAMMWTRHLTYLVSVIVVGCDDHFHIILWLHLFYVTPDLSIPFPKQTLEAMPTIHQRSLNDFSPQEVMVLEQLS